MKKASGAAIIANADFNRSAKDGPASQSSSSSNSESASDSTLFVGAFSSIPDATGPVFSLSFSFFPPSSTLSVFADASTPGVFFASRVVEPGAGVEVEAVGVATAGRKPETGAEVALDFVGVGVAAVGVATTGLPNEAFPAPLAPLVVGVVGAGAAVFGFNPQPGVDGAVGAAGVALASRKTFESTKPPPELDAEPLAAAPELAVEAATLGVRSESGFPQSLYGSASGSYFSPSSLSPSSPSSSSNSSSRSASSSSSCQSSSSSSYSEAS